MSRALAVIIATFGVLACGSAPRVDGEPVSWPRPDRVAKWPTSMGVVHEAMFEVIGMPEGAFTCQWQLVPPDGDGQLALGGIALGSLTVRDCCCVLSSAPTVDDAGRLVVKSDAGFVVWQPGWKRGREVSFGRWMFRNAAITTHEPALVIDGALWRLVVKGEDVFISEDDGVTWKPSHPEASRE